MTPCPNCAKRIRTDAGMAFHTSWCKPTTPAPAPIARPSPIAPKARRIGRRSRRPQVDRSTPAIRATRADELVAVEPTPMHPVLAHILRGEPLPDGYRIITPSDPAPEPTAGDTISRRDDAGEPEPSGPALAHDFGQPCACLDCAGPAPTPEPEPIAPKTRRTRAPKAAKSGARGGLTYRDGAVLIAGGRVRVSREAGDYSADVLREAAQIARGKSWTLTTAVSIEKLRPSPADGFELGPWHAWGAATPKAAPAHKRAARRPVGPGSCWCPRDHNAPATVQPYAAAA